MINVFISTLARVIIRVHAGTSIEARVIDTWMGYLTNASSIVFRTFAVKCPSIVMGTQWMIDYTTITTVETRIGFAYMIMAECPHISSGTVARG